MGRHRRRERAPTGPVEGAPALEARGLTRSFGAGRAGAVRAVDALSFSVQPGELYGLVGPDGAGKTTTIRIMTGLVEPDEGVASVLGMPAASGATVVREAIGYMPQQYSLYGDLSVDENLRFFGDLFGLSRKALAERRAKLLEITRLSRFGDRRAQDLSGGMYKKLALACALLHQPRVLVLDEPSNGVDPVSRRELWELLYSFVAEGMGVLLATPYMDEAARCHRVGLLHRGRLLAEGDPRALVEGAPDATLKLTVADRMEAEAELEARPEVLALSPQGADLRVVVRREGLASFERWISETRVVLGSEPVRPDFEDVYLAQLATAEADKVGGGGADTEEGA